VKLATGLHLVPRSKNAWIYTSTPQYVFMACCLVKHRDNFTLPLYVKTQVRTLDLPNAHALQQCSYNQCLRPTNSVAAPVKRKDKGKGKVALCLTKHHAITTYWGSGDIAPHTLLYKYVLEQTSTMMHITSIPKPTSW
jgi:hypothetical protein